MKFSFYDLYQFFLQKTPHLNTVNYLTIPPVIHLTRYIFASYN